jgi:formate C-acetyltransferase
MTKHNLSDRCDILRQQAVHEKPLNEMLCGQWAWHYVRGLAGASAECTHNAWLMAYGLAAVIEQMPVIIQENELIVGCNYGDGVCENLSNDPELARQQLQRSGFTENEASWFVTEGLAASRRIIRQPLQPHRSEQAAQLNQEGASIGFCLTDNHTVIGYEQVLSLGFSGLQDRIDQAARQVGAAADDPFYGPIRRVCQAACTLGDRFADEAGRLASQADPGSLRQAELQVLARICRRVPRYPARNFHEAVQSLWFAHMINTWEDGINANSLGRLDQILYPYYQADREQDRLTQQEAFELVCCLWIKLYRDYDVQQSCIGGCRPDGQSAVNELSWLMLDATEALDFVRCLSVRYAPETDRAFMTRALEVVGHVQKGIPFFFNDVVMIPALLAQGIDLADARDYTQLGCVETVIPGKSNPHAVTTHCNLLKAVEYTLGNGRSMIDPDKCPCLATGDPLAMQTFTQFKSAVQAQLYHIIEQACLMTADSIAAAAFNAPKPYKSLLTADCLERGLDFNNRGARYDYYQVMLFGLPNLADALAAVQEFVYRRQALSLPELIDQLQRNFPDEALRLDLVNKAPKFGNDIDEVDQLAVDLLSFCCDVLDDLSQRTGLPFHAQPFTFLWMVDRGRLTAATPDGRRKGEILAYSASPMQGRDFNGFTALMNSLAKLPTTRTAGTTSAIVEVDPQLFTDNNMPAFVAIMLEAARRGISNVQFNVVNADLLIEAQQFPDRHRNLAVRVSGFSQKFYLLDKNMQDHIIRRTKHKVL